MTLEGQDLEAEAERIKDYQLEKVKLVFLCLLLLTATIAFASSLRILFILSPRLAVILGLFTFIGISLWNLRHMQEVKTTKLCCPKEIYSKKLRINTNYISIFPTKTQVTSVVRRQRVEGLWMAQEEEREVVLVDTGRAWSHMPSSWNGYGSMQTPQPGYAPLRESYQPV